MKKGTQILMSLLNYRNSWLCSSVVGSVPSVLEAWVPSTGPQKDHCRSKLCIYDFEPCFGFHPPLSSRHSLCKRFWMAWKQPSLPAVHGVTDTPPPPDPSLHTFSSHSTPPHTVLSWTQTVIRMWVCGVIFSPDNRISLECGVFVCLPRIYDSTSRNHCVCLGQDHGGQRGHCLQRHGHQGAAGGSRPWFSLDTSSRPFLWW